MNARTIWLTGFSCAMAMAPFRPVLAQTGSGSATTSQDDSGLGDIIVTAQKRSENLKDVPISISAFSGEDTRRLNITDTKNLQFTTPGLSFPEDNATINPYIRGRGTNFSGPGLEGSIAVYIDDIYLQSQFGSTGLVDLAQIQVLKGPQGTLYGRNATGGAILITTRDPDYKLGGYVEVGYGSFQTRKAEGVLNIPLTDKLAVRIAGGYSQRDGFVNNVIDGSKNGASKRYQIRGKLLWEPTPDLKLLLNISHQYIQIDYLRNQLVDGTNTPTGLGFYDTIRSPRAPDKVGGENSVKVTSYSGKITYQAGDLQVTNVTGFRDTRILECADNDNRYSNDFDFCAQLPATAHALGVTVIPNPLNPNAPTTNRGPYDRTFTTETRVSSDFDGRFNFLVGGSYQHTKTHFGAILAGDAFRPLIPSFDNFTNLENIAFYGEVYVKPIDRFTLTLGGRYSRDTKDLQVYSNADTAVAFGVPLTSFPSSVYQRDHWNSFTPRVVLSYDVGIGNIYASYSAGFKSGGFNVPAIFPQNPLRPEKIKGFEIGGKFSLLHNLLSLELAGFHTVSTDIQVASVDTSIGGVVQQNAASAKADGAEASIRLRPMTGLQMQAGLAYLNSRFTSFPNASVFDVAFNPLFGRTLLQQSSEDLGGFATPLSPKWKANGNMTYSFGLPAGWNANLTVSAAYSGEFDFQAGAGGPQRYARQKSYTIINLNGDVLTPSENVTLSFFVTNLFQAHYYDILQTNSQTGALPQGGGVYGGPGLPRVFGGSVRVSF